MDWHSLQHDSQHADQGCHVHLCEDQVAHEGYLKGHYPNVVEPHQHCVESADVIGHEVHHLSSGDLTKGGSAETKDLKT